MSLFQISKRALCCHCLAGILWFSTLAGLAQSPVFTNTAIVNGFFQTRLLITSNADFTIETSTNLKDWTPVGSQTATNNLITLVDTRGLGGFKLQFYRIALGTVASYSIGFLEFADAGGFGGGYTPDTAFPVTLNSYSAYLQVKGDTNLPAATNVFFTGPPASGLTNSPANPDNSNTNGDNGNYQSAYVTNPFIAPGGTWTVNYNASNYTFSVSTPPSTGHVVVPYPTVTVSGDTLQSVSWDYRDATTGAILGGAPAYVSNIQLQVHGSGDEGDLYDSDQLTPDVTNNVLTSTVNWPDVSGISMAYQDSDGNNYVISYDGPLDGP